jgi:hypothetical protein
MVLATLNEAVPLQVLAADGRTDLYARAVLYLNAAVLTTLTLPHIDGGLYGTTYTPVVEGYISVVYKLFNDAGFSVPAEYDLESEIVEVSSNKLNILRILGLLHHNAVLDQQVYNGAGNMTAARLRSYDSVAHAQAAGSTGLLFTWNVVTVYTSGQVTRFSIEEAL